MNTNTIVMSQENISRPDDFSCSTNNDFPKEKAVSLFAHERHAMYDEQMMNMLYQRRENHRNGISKSYFAEEVMKLAKQKKQH